MFTHLKNLSEFSLSNQRLVYENAAPSATPGQTPPKSPEKKDLEGIHLSLNQTFDELLGERNLAVDVFVREYEDAKPRITYRAANKRFAELLNRGDLSADAQKGLVRVLQRYLNQVDASLKLKVDGELGPITFKALKERRTKLTEAAKAAVASEIIDPWAKYPAKTAELIPGSIAMTFKSPKNSEGRYREIHRMINDTWKDADGLDIRLEDALPEVATVLGGEIYHLKDTEGSDLYFKKDGTEAYKYTNRDDRDEFYFRLSNGKWIDKEGKEQPAKDVIPKIASMLFHEKGDESEVTAYGVYGEGLEGEYYSPEGERVKVIGPEEEPVRTMNTTRLANLLKKNDIEVNKIEFKEGLDTLYCKYNDKDFRLIRLSDGTMQCQFRNEAAKTLPVDKFPDAKSLVAGDIPKLVEYVKEEVEKPAAPAKTPAPTPKRAVETPEDIQYRLPIEGLTWNSMQDIMRKAGFQVNNAFFNKADSSYHFPYVYADISGDFVISKEGGMNFNLKSTPSSSFGEKYAYVQSAKELLNKDHYEAVDMPKVMETVMNTVKAYRNEIIRRRRGPQRRVQPQKAPAKKEAPAPAKPERVNLDQAINTLSPEAVTDYMSKAGFKEVRFQQPDRWLFRHGQMEGYFKITSDRAFKFSVNKPNEKTWVIDFPPQALSGRRNYTARFMPRILNYVKKTLDEYEKGGYGKTPEPAKAAPTPKPEPTPTPAPAAKSGTPAKPASRAPRVGLADETPVEGPKPRNTESLLNEGKRLSEDEAEGIINRSKLNEGKTKKSEILTKKDRWLAFPSKKNLLEYLKKEKPRLEWDQMLRDLSAGAEKMVDRASLITQHGPVSRDHGTAVAFHENGKTNYYLVRRLG